MIPLDICGLTDPGARANNEDSWSTIGLVAIVVGAVMLAILAAIAFILSRSAGPPSPSLTPPPATSPLPVTLSVSAHYPRPRGRENCEEDTEEDHGCFTT
jgi:hypothetical protein